MDRPLTPVTLIAALVASAVILWALPQLLTVAFTAMLAVLFGLALDAPVSALARRGLPRTAAVATVVVGAVVLVGTGLMLAVPSLVGQVRDLTAGHDDVVVLLVDRVNHLLELLPVDVSDVTVEQADELVSRSPSMVGGVLADVGAGLGNVLLAAVMAVWGVSRPDQLGGRLLRFVPPARRARLAGVARKIEVRLRRWIIGQLTVMTAVGAGSYVVFRLLDVPFAELFALAALVLEAVPLIGVILASAGPVLLLAIHDPAGIPWLLLGILVVQQLEDRLLIPRVVGRAVELPEVVVLAAVLTFGVLFGLGGMVVATPLTAALVTIHDELTAARELQAGADVSAANHVEAAVRRPASDA